MIVAPPPTSTNSLATICGRGTNGLQVTLSTFQAIFAARTWSVLGAPSV